MAPTVLWRILARPRITSYDTAATSGMSTIWHASRTTVGSRPRGAKTIALTSATTTRKPVPQREDERAQHGDAHRPGPELGLLAQLHRCGPLQRAHAQVQRLVQAGDPAQEGPRPRATGVHARFENVLPQRDHAVGTAGRHGV